MSPVLAIHNQLLATKLFVPTTAGPMISRPRLVALLEQSLAYPLTLISAPAGFGKTTLLSTWVQSLDGPHVCWLSLDEEENDPQIFWTYVISALAQQQPGRFAALLSQFQSSTSSPLKYLFTALINLLTESPEQLILILDDYHLITKQEVHDNLLYLIDHLPPQLRIILATRADPPFRLTQLQARQQVWQIRADQLRCTEPETQDFLQTVMHLQLSPEVIAKVQARTEGWLVGLQLLGLSLPKQNNPTAFLEAISGNQRDILDYLTQEVLERQTAEIQSFLLSTCILEQLTAPLCDAVRGEHDSKQMLRHLEQANLFVVALDRKHEWYRYHSLFAQSLHYQLEQKQPNSQHQLHIRASHWYASHEQVAEAIVHAFKAQEWQWATDLIEGFSLLAPLTSWGVSEHKLNILQDWLSQSPIDIIGSRPRLCLACAQVLWSVAPPSLLDAWLNAAERGLLASLTEDPSPLTPPTKQEQENLLGDVFAHRAFMRSYEEDGHEALPLCQRALALLSANNWPGQTTVAIAQCWASYHSSTNDAVAAIQHGLQACSLVQAAGQNTTALGTIGSTALHMLGTGQLHQAQRMIEQARRLGTMSEELVMSEMGLPTALQAAILSEWNRTDAALALAEEAIQLIQQISSTVLLAYLLYGYTVLLHILLSRRDYDAAHFALQQVERLSLRMNQPTALFHRSFFTTVDQVRLWLACGELDSAVRWAEELDLRERHGTPLAREREEVACARILLAKQEPALALQRLEPVFVRAEVGQRWGHVLEICILQAAAYQMRKKEATALDCLSQALRLGEPEGYIRSFLDEGTPIEALLLKLRKRERERGPTPYLDTLLAAFQEEKKKKLAAPGEAAVPAPILPEPLSEREQEVLQLLAQGASNQEIAENLVIATNTVKRHVRQVLAKLGVQNRFHAVKQAQSLGLLNS